MRTSLTQHWHNYTSGPNLKMAGIRGCPWRLPHPPLTRSNRRAQGFRCCSTTPSGRNRETQTPQLLKVTVSFVTELLRLFSPAGRERAVLADNECQDEISASSVHDVLSVIRSDYEKAYFVTGRFTSAIYAEDCIFEDPTIKFQGKELYARNLSLLVPFFDDPSIQLKMIEKGPDTETECIIASWKLRTYLKLPWRPLICVDGRTIYDLDEGFRIIKHVERWNISALEAVIQIFTPSSQSPDR